jgi:hypothetical protein
MIGQWLFTPRPIDRFLFPFINHPILSQLRQSRASSSLYDGGSAPHKGNLLPSNFHSGASPSLTPLWWRRKSPILTLGFRGLASGTSPVHKISGFPFSYSLIVAASAPLSSRQVSRSATVGLRLYRFDTTYKNPEAEEKKEDSGVGNERYSHARAWRSLTPSPHVMRVPSFLHTKDQSFTPAFEGLASGASLVHEIGRFPLLFLTVAVLPPTTPPSPPSRRPSRP